MSRALKLAGLVALLGLSACSMFKEPKNPPAALVDFKQTMSIKKVWSANIGSADDYVFAPVAVADSVFAAAANGKIVRVNATTGREIWKIDAGINLTAGVGADNSTLAVVGEKGVLLAYDLAGKQLWKTPLSSEVLSTPVVGGGLIVVRSIDNHIAAYDIATGKRRWVVERSLPPLILRTAAGLVISDNSVFVGLPGGKLISLTLNSGSVRWEASVGEPKGATELERVADVSGVPVVSGNDVCASAYQGKVSCFDIRTGVMRWGKALSTNMGVSVDERFVFAVDDKGTVNAFSRGAGLSEWKNDKLAYRKLSTPVSFGQSVAVADFSGYVHFLSREDGSFLARTTTDGSAVVATPIVVGANVVFQTKVGEIVAFAID
ncbi:outer membrane protein assembly factor BamB [Sapientia aquatica]|uniref:Outer membrane protein assembly factor BamB n=1 Tax=Sapientia aquatica TaxID=1549640 RepID=A0A4R5W640_9BURK|nr:outer membrane protein assembly factor BamB [Sapientia aquatica]TDK68253.1 outer membrane protein assembly factor BamB [Sapientia aquatica]